MDKGYLWFNVYSSYNFAEPSWPPCWCAHKSHLSFDEFSLWQSKLYTNEHLLMIQGTVQNWSEKLAYCFKSSLQGLTFTSSSKASSSTWGFMRGPKSWSYYTGCLVCKAICSSFAYVYVQRGVFVVLLLQLEEEWVSGPLTIPLEWREAVCVCAEKGPSGELCSEELGEFKGEAFGACLPQCGQEFSQSLHRKCAGFVGLSGHSLTQLLHVLNNTFSGSTSAHNLHMCSVFKDQVLCINNQPWWFPVELSSLPVWNVHDISHILHVLLQTLSVVSL